MLYKLEYLLDGVKYIDEFANEFQYLNRLYSLHETKGATLL